MPDSAQIPPEADVLILGGGLVGLTLAIALDVHGLTSIVVDTANPETVLAAGFDGAFGRYEEILRPYVTANQEMALKNRENGGEPSEEFADVVNSLKLPTY